MLEGSEWLLVQHFLNKAYYFQGKGNRKTARAAEKCLFSLPRFFMSFEGALPDAHARAVGAAKIPGP